MAALRAPALPAQSNPGGGSEGAVEAPFDDPAPALPAQSNSGGGSEGAAEAPFDDPAPALPAQSGSGGGSEGAAEAPFDDPAPALPAQSGSGGGSEGAIEATFDTLMTAATDPELRRRGVTPLTAHLGKACTAGVFLVIAGSVAAWVANDRQPPAWDHANHLERAVACAEDLSAGRVRAILERSSFYPPLVPCAAGVVYLLAPSDAAAAQAVILLFLGLGMLATYLVGHRLFDPTAGMVAAVLFATAPFVVFSALNFQLDLPLTAMVALFLYVLLRADGLPSTAWSVAAGGVFAAGMLTKPPLAGYPLPPAPLVTGTFVSQRAVCPP